jgi:hypothetical protein
MDGMMIMKRTTTTLSNTPPCADAAVATTIYHGTISRWDTEQGTQKGKKEKDQIQECIQQQGNINNGNTGIFIRKVSETNGIQLMYSIYMNFFQATKEEEGRRTRLYQLTAWVEHTV